jgi:hypothetical protein
MSDETAKDVSPLRLKRPGSPALGGGASQSPVPSPSVPAPAAEGGESVDTSEAASAHAPVSLRRRPTLAPDSESEAAALPEPLVEAAPPPAPVEPSPPIKLRVGIKPPAPPPPAPDPAAALPEDLFPPMTGVPLMPLPGMPAMPSIPLMPGIPTAGAPLNLVQRPTGSTLIGTEVMSGSSGLPPSISNVLPAGMDTPLSVPGGPPPLPPNGSLPPLSPADFVVPLGAAKPPEKPDAAKFKRKSTARDYFIYAGAFVILVLIGGVAYFYFSKPEETKAAFTGAKEKFDNAVKLPPGVLGDPKSSIDGAKDAMTNKRDSKLAPIDAVLSGGDADPGAAKAKAEAAAVAAKAAAAKIEKSTAYSVSSNTGVVVAAATATAPAPNPRFLRYAEALVVSGVFQGEPARALVDGRIIRSGDVIEPMLAVTFLGVDAPAKQLILGDKTGAQVRVKY